MRPFTREEERTACRICGHVHKGPDVCDPTDLQESQPTYTRKFNLFWGDYDYDLIDEDGNKIDIA